MHFFFIQLSWFMINLPCLYVVNICHNFIVVVMKRGKEETDNTMVITVECFYYKQCQKNLNIDN